MGTRTRSVGKGRGDGAKTGAHGWPLVPSKHFPGETTLACPKCGSTNVMMTSAYPVRGTGPGGRGRLGDPGGLDILRCESCKHESSKSVRGGGGAHAGVVGAVPTIEGWSVNPDGAVFGYVDGEPTHTSRVRSIRTSVETPGSRKAPTRILTTVRGARYLLGEHARGPRAAEVDVRSFVHGGGGARTMARGAPTWELHWKPMMNATAFLGQPEAKDLKGRQAYSAHGVEPSTEYHVEPNWEHGRVAYTADFKPRHSSSYTVHVEEVGKGPGFIAILGKRYATLDAARAACMRHAQAEGMKLFGDRYALHAARHAEDLARYRAETR